jgi:large subunit ribosomal protein L30
MSPPRNTAAAGSRARAARPAPTAATDTLRVTQERSRNGANKSQLATLRSLGLRRIGHAVEVTDSPQARGMLHAVRHLVRVDSAAKP